MNVTTVKRPSKNLQANQTAAKFRGAADRLNRAKSLVESAELSAFKAIEEGARAVLRAGPLASEYVQGMGSWTFTIIVPLRDGGDFKDDIAGTDSAFYLLQERTEDFMSQYAVHVEPFIKALREFRELHRTYHDIFGRPAAYRPMRLKATGPITTDW